LRLSIFHLQEYAFYQTNSGILRCYRRLRWQCSRTRTQKWLPSFSSYAKPKPLLGATSVSAANHSQVARTPQKLRDLLEKEHSVTAAAIDKNLTIIQGNATDLAAVKQALAPKGTLASIIVSAVGGAPKFNRSLTTPFTLDQPTICEDSAVALVAALKELRSEGVSSEALPTIIVVSTTGLTEERDVPCLFMPLYHVGLKIPHIDKKIMERKIVAASTETGSEAPVSNFIIVRPSLLMDGPSLGSDKVRTGWVKHENAPHAVTGEAPGPAIGYTIRRVEVGTWIFENGIKNVSEYKGRCVTLTY
jgi:hypothetical protein